MSSHDLHGHNRPHRHRHRHCHRRQAPANSHRQSSLAQSSLTTDSTRYRRHKCFPRRRRHPIRRICILPSHPLKHLIAWRTRTINQSYERYISRMEHIGSSHGGGTTNHPPSPFRTSQSSFNLPNRQRQVSFPLSFANGRPLTLPQFS